jgi:DNA-binding NarL/FixJ family response regulator
MPDILLVDDSQLMRQQIRRLIEKKDSWSVSGEAENGAEAVTKFEDVHPDLIIMDFEMPQMNGLDAAKAILDKFPDANILMLSIHIPGQLAQQARKIGIKGACPKSEMWCLTEAINAVLRGETYFPH